MRREIKKKLISRMEIQLDPSLGEVGFKRRKGSLTYKRKHSRSTQVIDLLMEIHPRDNPNAAAAIYPRMKIIMPEVDVVLEEMTQKDSLILEGVTGGVSRQPIGFTSQKEHVGRWYLYQEDSISEAVEEIRKFVDRWTLPFLDVYATPEDVISADQRNDGRLVRDRAQMMRVVAASLVCHRRDYADEVMEKYLGAPGARRRYQRVFEYIQQYE